VNKAIAALPVDALPSYMMRGPYWFTVSSVPNIFIFGFTNSFLNSVTLHYCYRSCSTGSCK